MIRLVCKSTKFINIFCRANVVCLSEDVASVEFRLLKDFDFLAKVLVRVRVGNGKASVSAGSGIKLGEWVLAGVLAGATGIGDRGGLRAATVGDIANSADENFFFRIAWSLYSRASIYKL